MAEILKGKPVADALIARMRETADALKNRGVEPTLCVVRVGSGMQTDGYLICAERRNRRIWQQEDCAILFFLAKMTAWNIRTEGGDLEQAAEN